MAGTLAQAHVQLQNAESSILFMQQEHAKTLQGLYAEINKLQKKCGGRDICYPHQPIFSTVFVRVKFIYFFSRANFQIGDECYKCKWR